MTGHLRYGFAHSTQKLSVTHASRIGDTFHPVLGQLQP
jgi:hypothetical protein